MSTWYTSDSHFGHVRINELSGRPFASVAEMNDVLVERWNSAVAPDDTVFHLGDVALGPIRESLGNIARLNGRKVLVPGNHDRCWLGDRRNRNGERAAERLATHRAMYLDAGFDEVIDVTHNAHQILLGGQVTVGLSHIPYAGDSQDADRYADWRPVDDGAWLVHGHVHEKWRQRGRMINVGVDAWDGFPVPEATLSAMIGDGEQDLAPLDWT